VPWNREQLSGRVDDEHVDFLWVCDVLQNKLAVETKQEQVHVSLSAESDGGCVKGRAIFDIKGVNGSTFSITQILCSGPFKSLASPSWSRGFCESVG